MPGRRSGRWADCLTTAWERGISGAGWAGGMLEMFGAGEERFPSVFVGGIHVEGTVNEELGRDIDR